MANVSYSSPVQSGTVTSIVGPRSSPGGVGSTDHKGTDFGVPSGTPVYSTADGTVSYVGNNPGGYGNYIVVDHADGTSTLYGHLSSTSDTYVGETVGTDSPIGLSGQTGAATGPHLHYEHYNTDDEELQPPFGDNQSLNDAAATKGSSVSKDGSSSSGNGDSNNGQDNTKGKNGNQDGTDENDKKNKPIADQKKPLDKNDHKDITGTPSNYQQTTTKSAVSVLPTHEPWSGHPVSCKAPRGGTGDASGNGGGGGSGGGGSGGGGNGAKGPAGKTSTSPGVPLTGSQADRINQAYDRLIANGFTPAAAQASVANLMGEGLLANYTNVHNDVNGPSSGIAQWHDVGWNGGGRYSAYNAYMNSKPGGAASLDNQIDYYVHDLKTNYPGVYNTLQNSDAETGVAALVNKYEVPANKSGEIAKRRNNLGKVAATRKKRLERGDPRHGDENKQDPKAANNPKGQSGTPKTSDSSSSSTPSGTSSTPSAYTPPAPDVGTATFTGSDGTTITAPGLSVTGKK